jgi:transposase
VDFFNGVGALTISHLTLNSSLLMAADTSIESNTITLHLANVPSTKIAGRLHGAQTRISWTIRQFHQSSIVPDALRIGRSRKMQSDLVAFIEVRRLCKPSISGVELNQEIEKEFSVSVSCTTINVLRRTLQFKYQPPRHNQRLTSGHIADHTAFCTKILAMKAVLQTVHFSDESRIVISDDPGWI